MKLYIVVVDFIAVGAVRAAVAGADAVIVIIIVFDAPIESLADPDRCTSRCNELEEYARHYEENHSRRILSSRGANGGGSTNSGT